MTTNSRNLSTMVIFFTLSFLILVPSRLVSSYESKVFLSSASSSPSSDDYDYIDINLSPSPYSANYDNYISPPSPSPSSDDYDYNDKMSPEFKRFVARCGENLSNNCGDEIRNDLLGIKHVSGNCCEELVKMGWICHKGMVRLAVSTLDNMEEAYSIISNSARCYNRCAKIINRITV